MLAPTCIPRAVVAFRRRHPAVEVAVEHAGAISQLDAFANHEIGSIAAAAALSAE